MRLCPNDGGPCRDLTAQDVVDLELADTDDYTECLVCGVVWVLGSVA